MAYVIFFHIVIFMSIFPGLSKIKVKSSILCETLELKWVMLPEMRHFWEIRFMPTVKGFTCISQDGIIITSPNIVPK